MENIKDHIRGTAPSYNGEIAERGKNYNINTEIHDRSLSWLGTGISIKSGGVKLVLWTQTQIYKNVGVIQILRLMCPLVKTWVKVSSFFTCSFKS